MKYEKLRGVKDILPEESFLWEYVIKKAVEIFKRYNYLLIITPTIEEENLFIRSIGDSSDIVMKEMYNFLDKKGRKIALRPEGTASVVRAFIESSGNWQDFFYIGQMFRYDKPQKGRDREFYQIGVESFGINSEYKDAEIIKLGKDILDNIGINSYEIQINNIGTKEDQKNYSNKLKDYFIKNKEKLCEDCVKKLERSPLRILDCKNENCNNLIKNIEPISCFITGDVREKYEKTKEILNELDIKYAENRNLVRGLDYYTGIVFEFITDKLGKQQNTILAGGRYDNLVEELGGKKTPAIGFAMGIERICEILKAENFSPVYEWPDVFLIYDRKFKKEAFLLLNNLRNFGLKAAMSFDDNSFKSQMRQANKLNSKFALIIGEEEMKTQKYSLKNMKNGIQENVAKEDIVNRIKQG